MHGAESYGHEQSCKESAETGQEPVPHRHWDQHLPSEHHRGSTPAQLCCPEVAPELACVPGRLQAQAAAYLTTKENCALAFLLPARVTPSAAGPSHPPDQTANYRSFFNYQGVMDPMPDGT